MKRTDQQRKAIEVYCREVANALNDKSVTLDLVLKAKPLPVSCTQENIKENIFKPLMNALYPECKSTTQLEKTHVTDVYDHMNKWIGEEFEVHIPFPSETE